MGVVHRGAPLEVAAAHRQRPFPPMPPTIPGRVAGLVADLTAKDPAARPASAAEVALRAGQLRDALAGNATIQLAGSPDFPPVMLADADQATLAGMAIPEPPAPGRPWHDRVWTGRGVMAAVAAAAVLAGLAGWLLAGVSTGPPQQHSATTASGPSAVQVNASSLTGQPVSAMVQRLRQLGLRPRVQWAYGEQQAPGTVMSVQPTGQLPHGSITVVTAAFQPSADRRAGGQGNNGD